MTSERRVCVVTGAQGALGSAVVDLAAAQGMSVIAIDLTSGWTNVRAALCLGNVDLRKEADALGAIDQIVSIFDRLDALLNVAGGFAYSQVCEADGSLWTDMYALNCVSAINACRAALPYLKKSETGRIVNVGAASAIKGASGIGPYCASKSALHRFTESLASELRDTHVTVNAVLPSIIDTPANRRDMKNANFASWVQPRDLAEVMLFLASPAARAITGALIPVTGRVV